jgi:Domain of unknown function (DUF4286)
VTTADIVDGVHDEFNRWYNERHVPDLLSCPGFLTARRYRCIDGQPQYLAIYEVESEAALSTPERERVRGFGAMMPYVRSFTGRPYRLIHAAVKNERP